MNGPEHYREAERILDHGEDHAFENDDVWYANAMLAAQAHATLALAAATAEQTRVGDVQVVGDADEWRKVLHRPKITNHRDDSPRALLDECTNKPGCPSAMHVASCPAVDQ